MEFWRQRAEETPLASLAKPGDAKAFSETRMSMGSALASYGYGAVAESAAIR